MISPIFLLLSLVLNGSHGFVPNSLNQLDIAGISKSSKVANSFSRRQKLLLSNDNVFAESIEPQEDLEVMGKNLYETPMEEIPYQTNSNPLVPGEELLLETISNCNPDDVFKGVQDSIDSIFSDDASLEGVSSLLASGNALSGTEYADFGNTTLLNEDVIAVLEASEAAVVEAEASMSPDLIQQLEFSPTVHNSSRSSISTPLVVDEIPEILTASSVVGEAATSAKIEAPDVAKILKFAIPAIGVWLCGPLLSLIDTSAVGLFSGTIHQAALNPAVAVTDYAALLIAFMYTGTTNLVAAAQESDRTTADKPATTKTLVGAMRLSTYVGTALGAILFAFARPLLKAIIGNDGISPAVFTAAMKYVRIRALGMPAAAIIGSTQAACLGMQDIRSPLYVLVAAAVANFFGDVFFVSNPHPWIGGAAGAAWATVLSQYVGVALFVRWLTNKPGKQAPVVNLSNAILEMTGKPNSDNNSRRQHELRESLEQFNVQAASRRLSIKRICRKVLAKLPARRAKFQASKESFSVRGFLSGKFSARDLLKAPSEETRKQFTPYLLPVTTTQVGRVSGYVAMSHVVASSLGTVSMAAQQVIVSLFYCLCPIADSLSLTAQSFLPAISEKDISPERSTALRKTAINFLKAGGVFGGAMMAAVCAIPLITGFFTSDPAVVGMVNSVVPLLLAFFGVHGIMCSSEGLLLGQKDLNFLGKMYGSFFFAVPYLMMRVKHAALAGSQSANLFAVWNVFLGYQLFRTASWLGRVIMLQRRTNRAASKCKSRAQGTSFGLAP